MSRSHAAIHIPAFFVLSALLFSTSCFAAPLVKEQKYTQKSTSKLECFDAKVTVMEHDKTGAKVVIIKNDDPNRYFMLQFDTPVSDDRGIPHVFEHSAMNGSLKYNSRSLAKALFSKGFVTFGNAYTEDRCTVYPIASLSEKQLLKLADYYTDACFEPLLLANEDIFRSEAWSYSLPDKDSDITVGGTIYSEMSTEYTAGRDALRKALRILYPTSSAAHEAGGVPDELLTLKYEDVKEYHSRYYHPSNCIAYLYGDIKNPDDFLGLLDTYFSKYEKKNFATKACEPGRLNGYSKREYDFPATNDASSSDGSEMVYAVDMKDLAGVTKEELYAFRNMCNQSSSTMMMTLLSRFPSSDFDMGIESEKGVSVLTVNAHRMKKEDADAFKKCVSDIFTGLSKDGAPDLEIENFRKKKEFDHMLSREGSNTALMLLLSSALMESNGGSPCTYMDMIDAYKDMNWFDNDAVKTVSSMLAVPERAVLTVVTNKPGLAEEKAELLAEKLAKMKETMTADEITKLVDTTKRIKEASSDDPSRYLEKLCVAQISDLAEDVASFNLDDHKDTKGVRQIFAPIGRKGISSTKLYLDAPVPDEEDIYFLALYTDLVNGHFIPAGGTSRNDIPGLIGSLTADGQTISLEVSSFGDVYTPYVTADFVCASGDEKAAFELLYDRLFDSDFTNTDRIAKGIEAIKRTVRSNIDSHPEKMTMLLAASSGSNGASYYENTHYIEYYDFLQKASADIKKDPKAFSKKLEDISKYLDSADGTVLTFAAASDAKDDYLASAAAFTGKLGRDVHKKVSYDLTKYEYPLAVSTNSNMACNAISSPGSFRKMNEDNSAAEDVALSVLTDQYLWPVVRNNFGAYVCDYENDDDLVSLYSSRDPYGAQTLDVFCYAPDAWRVIRNDLTAKDLDNYIFTAYAQETLSKGEIKDAMNALDGAVKGLGGGRLVKLAKDLKKTGLMDLAKCDALFDDLKKEGQMVTAGPAQLIDKDRKFYKTVLAPFAK